MKNGKGRRDFNESGLESLIYLAEDRGGGHCSGVFSGDLCGQKSSKGETGSKGCGRWPSDIADGSPADSRRFFSAFAFQHPETRGGLSVRYV